MKKWILVLPVLLIFQLNCLFIPAFAQYDQNEQDIKSVIEKFVNSLNDTDLDSAMKQVSASYSCEGCKANDYNSFRSGLENSINQKKQLFMDYSISEIQFNNLVVQDNAANVDIAYNFEGFNLEKLVNEIVKIEIIAALKKEEGLWKITRWQWERQ